MKRGKLVLAFHGDDGGTPSGQQGVVHPAFRALGIADAPPILELRRDLDRQARPRIDPGDIIVLGGARADIHMI